MQIVHHYLKNAAEKHPHKAALIYEDRSWSYRELDDLSDNLAGHLITCGLKPGERVVIFMDNIPEAVVALYAVLKAGGVFVMVSGALKAKKLAYILADSGCTMMITQSYKSAIVQAALETVRDDVKPVWLHDRDSKSDGRALSGCSWEVVTTVPAQSVSFPDVGSRDLAALIYTSGSTGVPKGIISAHYNIVSAAGSIISYLENSADDVIINVLPLSFDYGLYQALMTVMSGGTLILEKTFMYPVKVLRKIEEFRVTGFPLVPTLLTMILKNANLERFDLSGLRFISSTGAALTTMSIRALRKVLPHVALYSMYGLTECKRVSYLPPSLIDTKPESVGIPMPDCLTCIVDDKGHTVPIGQTGELIIKGPHVMQGYWNDPELTSRVFRRDETTGETWLYSGDLFRQDEDGLLYFVGRRDDLIKTKGERVSPKEIENVIAGHPDVSEVAVIGIPDDMLGKAIKAFIVLKDGAPSDQKEILKYCAENMETIMVPKYINFKENLPRTANGKIDKKQLILDSEKPSAEGE